jgi:uncharacterized membrane protein
MRRSMIFGAAALVAATALSVGAQQQERHHGAMGSQDSMMSHMHGMQGGMMQGGMMGMMQTMHPGPGMILGAADQLELTPEQKERLTALRDGMQSAHREHMQAAMASHQAAASALEGDSPDLDVYRAQLETAAGQMVAMHVSVARAALEAREILSAEQRSQLENAVSMMRHMHGNGMGGMTGGGMMPGGGMGSAR